MERFCNYRILGCFHLYECVGVVWMLFDPMCESGLNWHGGLLDKRGHENVNDEADQRPTDQPVDRGSEESFGRGHCGDSPDGSRAAKLGTVEYYLGVNHVETEELSAGEEHFMNCMTLQEKWSILPENITQGFLETAETMYICYMKEVGMRLSMCNLPTLSFSFWGKNALPQQERIKRFEMAYTHTLYYLAQMYNNLELYEKRQLEFNQFIPLEWAMNAATLSQYYITKTLYMEGRHCLSAAIVIAGLAGEVPSEAAAQVSKFSL
uniref:KIF-binding protein n=1 Tax=Oncorhynchus kisutch TaxID=8019 RepID=A0A8C7IK59_ONCKI